LTKIEMGKGSYVGKKRLLWGNVPAQEKRSPLGNPQRGIAVPSI